MELIIIGIHGLANKPEKEKLQDWWEKSIREGLNKNLQIENPELKFEMVYWTDLLYKHPQHNDEAFNFDKLYNEEPYVEAKPDALIEYEKSWLDEVRGVALDKIGDSIDFLKQHVGMDFLADRILEKVLKDLAFYYDEERKIQNRIGIMEVANKVLKDELINVLERNKDKEIMLIAHSMGTIIAYDVLRDLGQRIDNDISVKHFVTMGSPLGLPHVKHKILEQRAYDKSSNIVRTPTIVTDSWINYADKKDPVAIDFNLADDFAENLAGIEVKDDLVSNDYEGIYGKRNHHKSYGYLRTPELSRHITEFIA